MSPACVGLLQVAGLVLLLAPPNDDHGDPLPPGATARLGTLRLRHVVRDGSGATCVTFSPDGKTVVSGGDVGLRAWDATTGRDLGWFANSSPATAARFNADGKTLVTVDKAGAIRSWEASTGKRLQSIFPPRDFTVSSGLNSFLSANGKIAGVAYQGGGVHLWETDTGKQILARKEADHGLYFSAALSPDGNTLVVGGARNRAHLLTAATGQEVRILEGPNLAPDFEAGFARLREESVWGFTFAPDGKTLAAVSGKESLSVWNVADGRRRYTIKATPGFLAFTPDGKQFACSGDEVMRLYETATGKEVRRFEPHVGGPTRAVAFSHDGTTIATAGQYTIALWDVATGKRRHPLGGHVTPVISLAFSPDGSSLASGDSEEATLLIWDLKTRRPRHTFTGHQFNVLALAYSPDGKTLATGDGILGTGGFDAQIRLWDIRTGRLLRQFQGHLNSVQSLSYSADGKRLVSAGHDARTKVWDATTGQRLLQIRGRDAWSKSAAFAPDGKTVLVGRSSGELALWRLEGGQKVRDLGTQEDNQRIIFFAVFLPGGRTVLTHEFDRERQHSLRVWDASEGSLLRSFALGSNETALGPVVVSPDGSTLAIGGGYRDPHIQLWDTTTGQRVGRFSSHHSEPTALAFSVDGKTLASGGRDTTVLLWDVAQIRLGHLWNELRSDSATRAGLAAIPDQAVSFLAERLRRVAAIEERARGLIADLDSNKFRVREKAAQALASLGAEALYPVQNALQGTPSAEARQRLEKALDQLKTPQAEADFLPRKISLALKILEQLGTPEARRVLEELAKGAATSTLTREAAGTLERLNQRRQP